MTYDGPKSFNSLPKEVRSVTGCSVDNFKSGLDKFLYTIPDEPPVPGYTASCRTSNTIAEQVTPYKIRTPGLRAAAAADHHGSQEYF
ncbi:hypothetical protein Pmani_015890 [Petrolisthes manimaculis]|uniref:Uncharacterized protein n=1 Tax=Petrolisthes manimaculis TaxID=1843537 RepID=A0AAE1PQ59_9EUCA|nr:hypothetical protein Pmani_015890 [Petrolisthes manimaculis]